MLYKDTMIGHNITNKFGAKTNFLIRFVVGATTLDKCKLCNNVICNTWWIGTQYDAWANASLPTYVIVSFL